MSITEQSQSLHTKIEPRGHGTMTESGLLKLSDGTLMARRSTESGAREEAEALDTQVAAAEEQMAMLEAAAAKKPGRSKKKATAKQQSSEFEPVYETVTVGGLGDIRTQYSQVCIGTGLAMLGLTTMSFVPTQAVVAEDGTMSPILKLSSAPDRRYIYTGNKVVDRYGDTNIFLIEIPKEI